MHRGQQQQHPEKKEDSPRYQTRFTAWPQGMGWADSARSGDGLNDLSCSHIRLSALVGIMHRRDKPWLLLVAVRAWLVRLRIIGGWCVIYHRWLWYKSYLMTRWASYCTTWLHAWPTLHFMPRRALENYG